MKTANIHGLDINLSDERAKLLSNDWEDKRIVSMLLNTKKDDVVFDVGAEQGDMTVLFAKKGAKVHAFEPSPVMWGHIKENFEINNLKLAGYYCGFVGEETNKIRNDYNDQDKNGYPQCAYDPLDYNRKFRHMKDSQGNTNQITLNDYCKKNNVYPNLVTIDVEGTEYKVVAGMEKVLEVSQPIVFVSVHDDLLYKDYGKWYHDLWGLFNAHAYKTHYLGHDHESHFVFYKKSLKVINEIV